MKIVASTPASRAAHATAWPWLPALAATTPALRSSSVSVSSLFVGAADLERAGALERLRLQVHRAADHAAEGLGRVERRHAHALAGDPRARRLDVSECRVLSPSPSLKTFSMISRTAVSGSNSRCWTSSRRRRSSGSSSTARSRWVLARAEATANTSRARFLRRRSARSPSSSRNARCPSTLAHRSATPSSVDGLGEDDRRLPGALLVEREDRAHLVQHRLGRRVILLVDGDHVGDLHDPRLQRLDRVAGAGHQDEQHGVGDPDHLDLALARSDGLDEDDVLSGRVQDEQRLERRLGQPAEMPARAHRADEDLRVEEVLREPDAIAEQGALRERARRVDGDHADALVLRADLADERGDQARLADAGRPGDADDVGGARLRVDLADELVRQRVAVLDERDRPRERAPVALAHPRGERLARPLLGAPPARPTPAIRSVSTT